MLLQIFRHPCCLVAWSDYFFTGIAILGRFLAQPDSPGFTGFSLSRRGGQERKKERVVVVVVVVVVFIQSSRYTSYMVIQ